MYEPPTCFHPFQYITNLTLVGDISKGYAVYWLKCFSAIAKFHDDKQLQLSPSVVSHPQLVLEPTTATSGSKCQCFTAAEENNVFDDSSWSTKKSRASGVEEGKSTSRGKKMSLGIFSLT